MRCLRRRLVGVAAPLCFISVGAVVPLRAMSILLAIGLVLIVLARWLIHLIGPAWDHRLLNQNLLASVCSRILLRLPIDVSLRDFTRRLASRLRDVAIAFGEPKKAHASLLYLGRALTIPDRILSNCLLTVCNSVLAVRELSSRLGAPSETDTVAWVWSDMMNADTTLAFATNSLKRPLMQFTHADSDGKNETALLAILRNESQASMNSLLGHESSETGTDWFRRNNGDQCSHYR
jgi:hypothetical protein